MWADLKATDNPSQRKDVALKAIRMFGIDRGNRGSPGAGGHVSRPARSLTTVMGEAAASGNDILLGESRKAFTNRMRKLGYSSKFVNSTLGKLPNPFGMAVGGEVPDLTNRRESLKYLRGFYRELGEKHNLNLATYKPENLHSSPMSHEDSGLSAEEGRMALGLFNPNKRDSSIGVYAGNISRQDNPLRTFQHTAGHEMGHSLDYFAHGVHNKDDGRADVFKKVNRAGSPIGKLITTYKSMMLREMHRTSTPSADSFSYMMRDE